MKCLLADIEDIETDGAVYDHPRDPPGQRSVYIPPGNTKKESYRLSTFIKFPSDSPANPRVLAASGFFYTGYKDRVKCFCCGLCVGHWTIEDNVASTRWHKPDCKMMRGEDSGNIVIQRCFPNVSQPVRTSQPQEQSDSGGRSQQSVPAGLLLQQPVTAPSTLQANNRQPPSVHIQTRQGNQGDYQPVELATIPSVHHEQLVRSLDLRREADRLRTFDVWPTANQAVDRGDLARCGFFYLGNMDRVQCFSCGGVLRNWNYGDSVDNEHRVNFPDCRLVQNTDTQNVALSAQERPPVSPPEPMREPPDPSEADQENLRNMFPCLAPFSFHMHLDDSRFETFDNRWPAYRVRATPWEIARAGFFFLGERDRVKCWYCNGGLQNWEPDDEPWTEHAKWFPTCEFLLQRKGPDFVHRIVTMFPNLPRPRLRSAFDIPPGHIQSQRQPSPPPLIIDPREKERKLEKGIKERLARHQADLNLMKFSVVPDMTARCLVRNQGSTEIKGLLEVLCETELDTSFSLIVDVLTKCDSYCRKDQTCSRCPALPESENREGEVTSTIAGTEQTSLSEEQQRRRIQELQDARECKVCFDKNADVVLMPCGHLCSCTSCAQLLQECPVCRKKIDTAIRTYISERESMSALMLMLLNNSVGTKPLEESGLPVLRLGRV